MTEFGDIRSMVNDRDQWSALANLINKGLNPTTKNYIKDNIQKNIGTDNFLNVIEPGFNLGKIPTPVFLRWISPILNGFLEEFNSRFSGNLNEHTLAVLNKCFVDIVNPLVADYYGTVKSFQNTPCPRYYADLVQFYNSHNPHTDIKIYAAYVNFVWLVTEIIGNLVPFFNMPNKPITKPSQLPDWLMRRLVMLYADFNKLNGFPKVGQRLIVTTASSLRKGLITRYIDETL